jgi:hypothetical protein
MIAILVILGGLAMYHLVVESIIAPSLRDAFRYRLFAGRDRLRALRMENAPGLDEETFKVMESVINNSITLLGRLDVITAYEYERELRRQPALQKRLERRKEIVRACKNPAVVSIMEDLHKTVMLAVVVNMAGWLIYLIPIALIWHAFDRVKAILMVPESEIGRVLPDGALANDCA